MSPSSSPHPQSFPGPGSFPVSQFFASGGREYWSFSFSISPSNEYSGLISFGIDWLDLLPVQGTLRSLSSTIFWKHQSLALSLMVQVSHMYMTTRKTIALTIWTFVRRLMSLLFNMLTLSYVSFQRANIFCNHCPQWFWSLRKWNLSLCPLFPSIYHEVIRLDAMILVFWMLSFKPAFSVSSFHPHQEAL